MADQQGLSVVVSDAPVAGAGSSKGPRATISLLRARLTDGDNTGARVTFDQLRAAQEGNPELPLMEAMLIEAEGRDEEALACLSGIVASSASSAAVVALAHVRVARLATRLEHVHIAETSGLATLALDPEDINGLRALTFVHRRRGDADALIATVRRLARAPAASEADVWSALGAFGDYGRWDDVLELIERREFELDPWRMTPLRVRALVELGWRSRALEHLRKAYADEYIRAFEGVELLVRLGALALAATFIVDCMSSDPWQAEARKFVFETATRTCTAESLQNAPCQFADAIQAQDILTPGCEPVEAAVAGALLALTEGASFLLASNDLAGAVKWLVAAARLAPTNRMLLASLADAAYRAHETERYLDTLLRIWMNHRDVPSLLAAARGVLETSSWATVLRVMTIVATEARSLDLDIDAVAEGFREKACRKVDDYLHAGDVAAALELVIDLSHQWSVAGWPDGLLQRLLRTTKRRLRSQRAEGEALIATVGALYLELAPRDVEVCRMLARVRVRQRNLGDARQLLGRIVAAAPHGARDWVALAMVQDELGELAARDVSIARSLLIAPDGVLPPVLAAAQEAMGLA